MTFRLVATVHKNWAQFDGWAASLNIDPLEIPFPRFMNLAYFWLTGKGEAEKNDVDKIDRRLFMPPKGVAATEGPWSKEAETASFAAFSAEFQALAGG